MTTIGAPDAARCFFTTRWFALCLAVPLLLTTCSLLAGALAIETATLAIDSFLMVVCGLMGGLVDSSNRWFLWALGVLLFIPIARALWNGFYIHDAEVSACLTRLHALRFLLR